MNDSKLAAICHDSVTTYIREQAKGCMCGVEVVFFNRSLDTYIVNNVKPEWGKKFYDSSKHYFFPARQDFHPGDVVLVVSMLPEGRKLDVAEVLRCITVEELKQRLEERGLQSFGTALALLPLDIVSIMGVVAKEAVRDEIELERLMKEIEESKINISIEELKEKDARLAKRIDGFIKMFGIETFMRGYNEYFTYPSKILC